MERCEWCQEEVAETEAIAVTSFHLSRTQQEEWVCSTCADLAAIEHLALFTRPLFNLSRRVRRVVPSVAA